MIKRHRLGTDSSSDVTVLQEADPAFYLDLSQTKDKVGIMQKFIIVSSNSKTTSDVQVIDKANNRLMHVVRRRPSQRVYLEHNRGYFYLITNMNTSDFQVLRVPVGLDIDQAEVFVDSEPGQIIEEVDMFNDFLAIYQRDEGLPRLLVYQLSTGNFKAVEFKHRDKVFAITPGVNMDYEAVKLRFTYSSPVVYEAHYSYDMLTGRSEVIREVKLQGLPLYPERFVSRRVQVPSHDGVYVPMTLFHRSDLEADRTNRVLLKGYGAYGVLSDNSFKYSELVAVEEGWTIATTHVRGDGEKGADWHTSATLKHKHNSFLDFISCAQHLISTGWTLPRHTAAYGASAGGMLVAQAMNLKPELFAAVVLDVPFVDVLTCMLDESLPLTVTERDEWGDPSTVLPN
jgi:oligopeptidase B